MDMVDVFVFIVSSSLLMTHKFVLTFSCQYKIYLLLLYKYMPPVTQARIQGVWLCLHIFSPPRKVKIGIAIA